MMNKAIMLHFNKVLLILTLLSTSLFLLAIDKNMLLNTLYGIESLIFSILLVRRIKLLYRDKTVSQKRIEMLAISLNEKELLLRELNHRVKNSIQTIVSFLRLQIDEMDEKKTKQTLMNIENRILSISHLYSLLYTKDNICCVNTNEYFNLLVEDIKSSYVMPHIDIKIKTEGNISSEYAVYCGFILNETITNSLQHAFKDRERGEIFVYLKREDNLFKLSFYDNGIGYNQHLHSDSLGLLIIETLVETQLQGKLYIDSTDGTKIDIEWGRVCVK